MATPLMPVKYSSVSHPFNRSLHPNFGYQYMTVRSAQKTLESLRVTLQKLEHTVDPEQDANSMATFKGILLNRIADLEMAATLTPAESQTTESPAPADLVPPSTSADRDSQNQATGSVQLEALD